MLLNVAKNVLQIPLLYDSYQAAVGANRCKRIFLNEHVRARHGDHVLDIGCGTGACVPYLPEGVTLTGIDIDPAYVNAARRKYGLLGRFLVADAADPTLDIGGPFDTAFAFGVLHHLPDDEARKLIEGALARLRPGGRLVTIDPTFSDNQHPISRFLVANDRGDFVRTLAQMACLAQGFDARIQAVKDLLRVPYDQLVMQIDAVANRQ